MKAIEQYIADRDQQVRENQRDKDLEVGTYRFTEHLVRSNYTKNFTWMGVPILQYPSDLVVMQEIIWKVKPQYIIETGVAFGGMLLFYRTVSDALVIGIDIDIREHTHEAMKGFCYERYDERIRIIQGSSIDPEVVKHIKYIKGTTVLVSLDSNHTHDHVLQELKLYSPLVSRGSYIVVFDTAIEVFGHLDKSQDRPWGKGDNPGTAVREFLKGNKDFEVDKDIEHRALITAAPGGWLKRVK